MALTPQEQFEKLREQYQSRRQSFNALLIGDPGTGKTFALRTVRKPVLIYQFDPGGAEGLQAEIDRGEIFVVDYSDDDPGGAAAFGRWEKDFIGHQKDGFLEHFGTVCLDSLTTWSSALMNAILKANGRGFKTGAVGLAHGKGNIVAIPELRDYQLLIITTAQYMGLLTGIGPDFVATAHADYDKNEDGALIKAHPLVVGKMKEQMPLFFDEVYYTLPKSSSAGPEFRFLTTPYRIYTGRSRLSAGGKLDQFEPADFKAILKKVGREYKDLAIPSFEEPEG